MASASKEKVADSAAGVLEQFPVGLKVLVVDDDVLCLRIIEQKLRQCMYSVTSCSEATAALSLLRERKGYFDIVLSDVHMPDMDGFKLLEFVGLEIDLPVIMMSGDDRTSIVMRGIRHGACDYLIKPIRTEELQNIWQHVVRKRCNVSKEHEGSLEDDDQLKCVNDDGDYASSVNEGADAVAKTHKRRKDAKEEEDGDIENDDPTTSKKPRVVWSVELHQQFVSAVNQLGIDKAVPKRILELMNVPGLTRENVASHLQKFRLYLKRLSGVSHQQSGLPNPFGAPLEQNPKVGTLGGLDYHALAASNRISPEILAALRAEFLTRPTGNLVLPSVDRPTLLQASLAPEGVALGQNVAYGQPLIKCPSDISKQFSPAVDSVDSVRSGYGSWSSKDLVNMVAGSNIAGVGEQIGNRIMSLMQHQQQQHQQNQSVLPEPTRLINVQPSCHVPSNSSASIAGGNNLVSANQYCSFGRDALVEYSILSPQSNNSSFGTGKIVEPEVTICAYGGFSDSGSTSPSVTSRSVNADNGVSFAAQNLVGTCTGPLSALVPNNAMVCGSYDTTSSKLLDHALPKKAVFFGRGTIIPSRFGVDETEPRTMGNVNQGRVCYEMNGDKVKLEPNMNFVGNGKVGVSSVQRLAS